MPHGHYSGFNHAWMASGDNAILNDMLVFIKTCQDNSVNVSVGGSTYKGFPASSSSKGQALWESYLWRHIATTLRVMSQSPNLLLATHGRSELDSIGSTYQAIYDNLLAWTQLNIWDKWYNADTGHAQIYRVNTHMASHWARIGMELYIITGDVEYKEVFDNISFIGAGPVYSPNSLRSQIYDFGNGYGWASSWGGSNIQDTSHGSDIISFWVAAVENEMYWTQADMDKIANTVNDYIWQTNSPIEAADRINGTGGNSTHDASFAEYMTVARFNEALQSRMDTYYTLSAVLKKDSNAMGVGLYNRTLLDNGRPVYPENYTPFVTPDTTAPTTTSVEISNITETTFYVRWYIDEGSQGSIQYGTSTGVYTEETTKELSYPLTHGQTVGNNNAPALTPGTTYYWRTVNRDIHGNIGYSDEQTTTTLGVGANVISLVGDSDVNIIKDATYTELGATIAPSGSVTIGGDTVDTATVGTYIVSYSSTGATTVFRTVNVVNENTNPIKKVWRKISIGVKRTRLYLGSRRL